MKLYFAPGACSLSPHIVLREAGVPVELERVDLAEGRIVSTGEAFRSVNPKGYVPALEVTPGEVVTEGAAIVQHIADSNPQAGLAPAAGTLARARVNEWLTFLSSELHKAFSPLFRPDNSEEVKSAAIERVANRLDHIESVLDDGRSYLTGDTFTIADAYLFTLTNWTGPTGIGLGSRSKLMAYMDRVRQRPAVLAALEAEGLLQPAA
ncbi:glutathione transferase GstA [Maricaulis sp.]|uniref:glutathione transferase GstA n=1 Tax=Maricaulis sp. TaxID=1486257 RepID=UPI001B107BA5|nr:glutathione transferase GstA [Maricaulis sp.]MBO6766450.1 glutathione transferase GstA [Maricaulis sp.]